MTTKPDSDSTVTRPVSSTTPSDPPFGFSDEERADMLEWRGAPVATKATGKRRFVVTFTLEVEAWDGGEFDSTSVADAVVAMVDQTIGVHRDEEDECLLGLRFCDAVGFGVGQEDR